MHSTRTNASKRDDERRREDSPRPAPTTDRPTETSRRAAPRAPLPSPSRKSTSIKTKNGHTVHTITKIMPAPWIEHGILSLRRRAPVETGARRSKASHSFTSARVWVQDSRVTTAPYRLRRGHASIGIGLVPIDGSALLRGGDSRDRARRSTGFGDCYGSAWRVWVGFG